ncbi:SPOC domain-containing protein [Ampelomyces quisqualis]|uniref:Transcription factor BYE1 n=1 Tax=Ampelomyces quisqualis TaxID=50730 RepID=A0A6A5QB85_AMPQU|nr:SPOC domain-containing protein [Ampelomyces quisqualis]
MTDETRRSGRANKGQHTKNHDLVDEPAAPKTKAQLKADKKGQPKGKQDTPREQSAQSEEQGDDEDDAIIRCVCGDQRDIRGRQMICCDSCEAWQHNKCLGLPEGDYWEDKTYYCEQCRPHDHQDLLAAMARGEKPWARKKGSKPKPRPSDVKLEEKPTTPQASVSVPPSPVTAQPVQAPTPTLAQAEDTSNGQAEAKNLKAHLQSPVGEKRRHDAPPEKANASKKRRKSGQPQPEKATSQASPALDIDGLPATQKPFAEKLRDVLSPLIKAASDARGFRIPDGETPKSLAARLALHISLAAVDHYGEPVAGDSPFSARLRAIMFNVKKNTILVDRMLSGSLKPQELVSMPTEEMASEDKQKEFAAMREAAEKQMILTEEAGPRLRKTHKGEEIVGEDNFDSHEFKQPTQREKDTGPDDAPMQSPVSYRPPESPAETTNPIPLDTSGTPTDTMRRPSANFDINSVFDKVRSPQHDQQTFLLRRQNSMQNQERSQAPVDDADVDRLLKDEDNDVEMSGYSSDPTVCWQGAINMQSMQPFDAVARFVAGGDFGQVVPWNKLLANVLSVQGRIESSKGDDYIRGIGHSESYDVAILALSPITTDGRGVMDHFYTYFQSRGRWGVVPVETNHGGIMRDLYIIPIEAGGSNLPPFIDMLEYCTIETPRKEHMLLLALVAKLPEVKPELPPTEHFDRHPAQDVVPTAQMAQPAPSMIAVPHNGPSPSPVGNPHVLQYSPMAVNFPPPQHGHAYLPAAAHNGTPQPLPPGTIPRHHQVPKALEIMGPYIDAPVIAHILNENLKQNQDVSELQMINLRHIVENNPEARTNLDMLTDHLRKKAEAANLQQQQQQQGQAA